MKNEEELLHRFVRVLRRRMTRRDKPPPAQTSRYEEYKWVHVTSVFHEIALDITNRGKSYTDPDFDERIWKIEIQFRVTPFGKAVTAPRPATLRH
jgi:hypothetical protein